MLWGWFFMMPVQWYFEERYQCILENDIIQVSLTTGSKPCMEYMAGLYTLLNDTREDLKAAEENKEETDGYDRSYREWQLKTLQKKYTTLIETQQELGIAMDDFEKELFIRVKSLVWYYLFGYTTELQKKYDQWVRLMNRLLLAWNDQQYKVIRTQMDWRLRELIVLERIKDASDFAALVAPLKQRIKSNEQ
jgi:hypothetical protein